MAQLACIGAGLVGSAWAALFAKAGHEVRLYDSDESALRERALPAIQETLETLGAPSEAIDRVQPVASIAEAVSGAMLIQESVREDREIKAEIAHEIANHAPEDSIIASSTSAIPGSEFLSGIVHPERALVAHPVNPPSLIRLVELCGTGVTSTPYIDRAKAFYEGIGMIPIILSREIDGFLLNRLQYTLVAEAMHLVGEGYCSPEDIDKVLTEGLAPRWAFIGPFMTAHLNAKDGFKGFVDQLGPMMRKMGEDANTNYPWTEADAVRIHESLVKQVPIADIPEAQAERNKRIMQLRRLRQS